MSESTESGTNTDKKLEAAFDELENGKGPSSGSSMGSLLALLLALVALGVASYPAYEMYRLSDAQPDNNQVGKALRALESSQNQQAAQLAALEEKLGQVTAFGDYATSASLTVLGERIDGELGLIRGRMTTSSEDWLFAEVEYLVRMANQRVLMEKDPESALQLLQSADGIVREAKGLIAHELRAALAEDIAALKTVETPDVQGLYLELSAQIRQVSSLERAMPVFEPEAIAVVAETGTESVLQKVMSTASNALARLAHLIDFRRQGVEVKPILPPEQEYYLRQNLILKLQMAQMALLEGEGDVFRVSLDEASQWIEDSFDENTTSVAMQESLSRLLSTRVSADQPDISGSLAAARSLLEDFHRSNAE